MSTRRARIKAVAALPPRRRNAENSEAIKNKPATGIANEKLTKEPVEKALLSPKTPKNADVNNEDGISAGATGPLSPASYAIPTSPAPKTPNKTSGIRTQAPVDSAPSPKSDATRPATPKQTEKLAVPSTSNMPIFALPKARTSPQCKIFSPNSDIPSSEKLAPSDLILRNDVQVENLSTSKCLPSPVALVQNRNELPVEVYNVPGVPETITDDVMDDIVPLQSSSTAKPLEDIKNQMTSDDADVFFDPIIPLPSPSKVRPKLRPIPRLGPHRRNSVQGSASESEDESRRLLCPGPAPPAPPRPRHDSLSNLPSAVQLSLPSVPSVCSIPSRDGNRTRNDSVCSIASQAALQPPPATSPVKEKHFNKARRQEMSKRMWRRRRDTVKRDALTMYDLIFYNPTDNPIIPDQDEIKAKQADEADRIANSTVTQDSEDEVEEAPAAPVPQLKIGPNGEIVLDEKSLVIKTSETRKVTSGVVREGAWVSGGGRYSRAARTLDWPPAETVRFYRALAALGTDFSLMVQLFPDRNRRDLKLKFKKEERLNGGQVDKALRSATSWGLSQLQEDFRKEREEAVKQVEKERQILLLKKKEERERLKIAKEQKIRKSKGSKALENIAEAAAGNKKALYSTADDFLQRAMETRTTVKRRLEDLQGSESGQGPQFATLTPLSTENSAKQHRIQNNDLATISRVEPATLTNVPGVPTNIESGSLVVLRVNDPKSPSKTMLQTYIARGAGKLTPVDLPPAFLNSVAGYMKGSQSNSSPVSSLRSPIVQEGSTTPTVIQKNPTPGKRQRHSSYTITPI